MLWGGRWEGGSCLGMHVRIKDFKIKKKKESGQTEMARMSINILGVNELQWTGVGEFNLDNHYTYYCGQESLRRNGVAIMVNERVQNAVFGCKLKND